MQRDVADHVLAELRAKVATAQIEYKLSLQKLKAEALRGALERYGAFLLEGLGAQTGERA